MKSLNLTELEYKTADNCRYNGFGKVIIEQIITLMRKKNCDFLDEKQIKKIHSFKRLANGKVLFPYGFITEYTSVDTEYFEETYVCSNGIKRFINGEIAR